jgi:hypothetical protein|tara:strand:+ start:2053 stop:2289 length:237 start_codon:yes stop_codon:yes gene_type:complete
MSQTADILDWLKSGRSITSLEAYNNFGCLRLAARIADIRARGFDVQSKTIRVGSKNKTVAQYSFQQCDLFETQEEKCP